MALDLSRIQALCFDVDGTLSDTDDLYVQKVARLLRPLRGILPGNDPHRAARRLVMALETPGNAVLGLIDTLGMDDELIALSNFLNRRVRRRPKHFLLIPGVDRMLEELYAHYPMAIVSARDERTTLAFLEHFHLTHYFRVIVTALSREHTKPYPDPVLFAAEQMGVAPDACLMIGDTTVDIRAGRAAGAQTVGVLCGFGEEDELRRHGADLILQSTVQLSDVLLGSDAEKSLSDS
ncbi:MAG: HAD family hydrolase [Anaerolineae bacterium]|nr:MAG: HAD family hydrolase [Anaerolineae bacterium]